MKKFKLKRNVKRLIWYSSINSPKNSTIDSVRKILVNSVKISIHSLVSRSLYIPINDAFYELSRSIQGDLCEKFERKL